MSIEIKDLQFGYYEDGKDTLGGVNAVFHRSEITVLCGRSGCGKSTLLYLIAGIYPANAGFLRGGSVLVEGETPASLPAAKRCRRVGMMFQNPDLQFCMDTVRNELIFTAENLCIPAEEIPARIDAALAFSEIPHLPDRTLVTLSGGEKQKVALACLYLMDPAWMLLDEAFANVDDASAALILKKLLLLHKEKGTGILAVDHRLENWMGCADRIVLIEDGKVTASLDPKAEETASRLLAAGIGTGREGYPGLARLRKEPAGKKADTVLALSHVSVRYEKEQPILSDIDITFETGKIYAIVGQSGCGKSTLFGALTGLYPYEGSIRLCGSELRRMKRKEYGRLGFVTQSPQDQFLGGTVRQEVMAAFRKEKDADARSEEILRRIGLWKYRDISPYLLSQGQQRRLGVAALMSYPCRVLVCDEPTYAQDRENTIAIMDRLCGSVLENGTAMLFSTHDPLLAEAYADVVLHLKGGKLYA